MILLEDMSTGTTKTFPTKKLLNNFKEIFLQNTIDLRSDGYIFLIFA